MAKRSKKRLYAKAAGKCHPAGVRDALTSKWTAKKQAKRDTRKLGTFGAASEVVSIDPSEWKEPTP